MVIKNQKKRTRIVFFVMTSMHEAITLLVNARSPQACIAVESKAGGAG